MRTITFIRLLIVTFLAVLLNSILFTGRGLETYLIGFFGLFAYGFLQLEIGYQIILGQARLHKKVSWLYFLIAQIILSGCLSLIIWLLIAWLSGNKDWWQLKILHFLPHLLLSNLVYLVFQLVFIFWNSRRINKYFLKFNKKEYLEHSFNSLKSKKIAEFLSESLKRISNDIDKEDVSVEQIELVTNILRYLLQSREERFVSLEKETLAMLDYVQFSRNLIQKPILLKLEIEEEFKQVRIPPFVLQVVLEHQFTQFEKEDLGTLELEVYIENKNFVVVKSNLPKARGEADVRVKALINNLQERYRLFNKAAGVSIVSTQEDYMIKFPIL